MSQVDVRDQKGAKSGSVELDEAVFGIAPNVPVMHQVVTAQLAARRGGTQSTKTRAEVAGGGSKPWRQKGTGRSRQGSTNSPQWRGGGVAMGPKPRSYKQRTPKKMVQLALRSALSDRAADGKVLVVDGWSFDEPARRLRSPPWPSSRSTARCCWCWGRTIGRRGSASATCPTSTACSPANSTPTTCWCPTGSCSRRRPSPATGRGRRSNAATLRRRQRAADETGAVAEGSAGEAKPSGADDTAEGSAGEAKPSGADEAPAKQRASRCGCRKAAHAADPDA